MANSMRGINCFENQSSLPEPTILHSVKTKTISLQLDVLGQVAHSFHSSRWDLFMWKMIFHASSWRVTLTIGRPRERHVWGCMRLVDALLKYSATIINIEAKNIITWKCVAWFGIWCGTKSNKIDGRDRWTDCFSLVQTQLNRSCHWI